MYSSGEFSVYDLILWAEGLAVSLEIFFVSSLIGLFIGCLIGLLRYYRIPVVGISLITISEFLKNSPVLVQLFLVYFGIPAILGIDMTPMQAAMITLSGNTAAFIAVIVISSVEAIDKKQLEAARSFALSVWKILIKIIYPLALATSIPLLTSLAINQLQVTSLISVIGVVDLTRVGDILNQRTFEPFIVWPIIGITYYILAKIITYIGQRLEKKLRIHVLDNRV